jgi:hypothetical protein
MILSDFQCNGQFPSVVATPSTSPVYFPRVATAPWSVPAAPSATNATGQLPLSGSQQFQNQNATRFRVIASGTFTTGTASVATTFLVLINTGTLAAPAYTTLATGANTPGSAGTYSWLLEAHMVVGGNASLAADNGSGPFLQNYGSTPPIVQGQLSGVYMGAINSTLVDLTLIPATTNPVQWTYSGSGLGTVPSGLVANVVFGTGNAGNSATLNEFTVLGD